MCVGGSEVDPDGVCVEHGETACVTSVWDVAEEPPECDTDEDVRL